MTAGFPYRERRDEGSMEAERLQAMIREAIPGAEVEAVDLQGGDHFELTVVSDRFEKAPLVARHRMVYAALGEAMRGEIHALTIRAFTRAERDVAD
jgi:stress-induced morphogen